MPTENPTPPVEETPEVVTPLVQETPPAPTPNFQASKTATVFATVQEYVVNKYGQTAMTPQLLQHLQFLDEYSQNMHPSKPVSPKVGAGWQMRLYTTMLSLLSATGPDSFSPTVGIDALLFTFHRGRDGAFNIRYINRYITGNDSAMSQAIRNVFVKLTALCVATCASETRLTALRSVSFTTLAQDLASYPVVMQNIAGFFQALVGPK